MAVDTPLSNSYTNLLLKELDVIQDFIKNLDDIIHKSKHFFFLTWGDSFYLITQHLKVESDQDKGSLSIPLLHVLT
jgi:hypothetical protein